MAKKNTDKTTNIENTEPEKKKKLFRLNESWQAFLSITALVAFGFGIGFHFGAQDKNEALRQQDFECTKQIEQEKKEWEKERKNEIFLEVMSRIVSNQNNDNKNENK
ncbi:MAG: hypothetical protein LBU84_06365 [Prevotella sp.]|jgi:uncharacterized protein HemX|nr:hypothetical protein [Prevotella sp.]